MGFSGGGSTNIKVPNQLGQIGAAGMNLAEQEQNFLQEPISLGNYGVTLATGGAVPQAYDPFLESMAFGNPAVYNLETGSFSQPTANKQGFVEGGPFNLVTGQTTTGYPAGFGGGGGGTTWSGGSGWEIGGTPIGSMGGAAQGGQGSAVQQAMSSPDTAFNMFQSFSPAQQQQVLTQIGNQAAPGSPTANASVQNALNAYQSGSATANNVAQVIGTVAEQGSSTGQMGPMGNMMGGGGGGGMAGATGGWSPTTQVGGLTVPNQNPLYGPWLNTAVSGMQAEAGLAPQLAGMIQDTQTAAKNYYGETNLLMGEGNQMLQYATTGPGTFPSQQALIDAQVKAGQSGVAQQLASEGMSQSTLGPELNAEIGLQGAATAGQLIQGNISSAVNVQQAAQGWGKLALGEQTLGFGEEQALGNLFSTLASQGAGLQNQLWQQGLQGYGLEGAFLNNVLNPYGTSLQAYHEILSASIAQAQINEQAQASANAANASVIGSVVSAIGSAIGGIGAGGGICWVAREVIPDRWIEFRSWLFERSPNWFRNLYIARGERFARFISNKPLIKFATRKVFEVILYAGRW